MRSLEVEIERILPGGSGLAHAEGLTIFVPLTAPGDVVRIDLNRVKGKLGFATLKEVVKASPDRVEAPCPYFGRCGGCDFQQLTYKAQLQAKLEIIRDCLHRIAQIKELPSISIEASVHEWQYRSRASWQIDPSRQRLGYFQGGSHRICDVEYCAILVPKLEQVLETLREKMRKGELNNQSGEVNAVAGDNEVSVSPPIGGYEPLTVDFATSYGTYEFNADSFFQINQGMLEPLVKHALASLPEFNGGLALDLYCGVGLFTLPLARQFEHVIGIEGNAAAVRFAKRNVLQAGLNNVRFASSKVGDWLLSQEPLEIDFLLLDPPRTGAEPTAVEGILKHKPKRIGYVSCDPATLSRDLKMLLTEYSLQSVSVLDLFPQTHHVETVVHLTRNDRRVL